MLIPYCRLETVNMTWAYTVHSQRVSETGLSLENSFSLSLSALLDYGSRLEPQIVHKAVRCKKTNDSSTCFLPVSDWWIMHLLPLLINNSKYKHKLLFLTKVIRKTTCLQHVDTSSGDRLMLNMTVKADACIL